jgi:hypothetical protein
MKDFYFSLVTNLELVKELLGIKSKEIVIVRI